MHRVVAMDYRSEQMIDEVVDSTPLAWELVRDCLRAWPDAVIYIDGEPLNPVVVAWFRDQEQGVTPQQTMPGMTIASEQIPDFAASVCRFYDDALQAQIRGLSGFMDRSQRFGELIVERDRQNVQREREVADEFVRQRKLVHHSLADVDLFDRSAKVASYRSAVALTARPGQSEGISFMDFMSALSQLGDGN